MITGIDQSMLCLTTALKKWENDGGKRYWCMLPETYWEAAAAELGLFHVLSDLDKTMIENRAFQKEAPV